MEDKNKIKNLYILIVVLVILVLVLVGYIVYDKVSNNKEEYIPNNTTTNEPTTNIEKETIQESEKETIYNDITSSLNSFIGDKLYEHGIKFDYDYMKDEDAKNYLVVSAMIADTNIKKERDIDANGQEETGAISFNRDDFVKTYVSIIGVEPDLTKKYDNITITNNKIFSYYVTGSSLSLEKLNSITYENKTYTMKIDYVYSTNDNYEAIDEAYDNYSKTNTFDDELINAIIEINFEKNTNNTYKINSLIVKKRVN